MADRKVLRISGADREEFLQNLVTNDVSKLADGLVWAGLLTPQGKYLADFFLVPDGDSILLDVDASLSAGLAQRLRMYKLRADVEISETDIQPSRGIGPGQNGAFADPRHPSVGWRAYDGRASTNANWDEIRVESVIPESGVELIPNESYPLESGFERLGGLDFKKGCYVGQEVTARMKHKTELRKGLAQVRISGSCEPGTDIINEKGKPVGAIFTQSKNLAIAYIRFDRVTDKMTAGDATVEYG